MDATALCFRLSMKMLILLVAQVVHSSFAQKPDAVLPRVSPDRLQFFEYETVSVSCEEFTGPTEWRVMRKLNQKMQPDSDNWNSSAPSYTIPAMFAKDTGEYWCEDAAGNTSDAVNITVTAGSAILDIPARPVVEGQEVVLHCRKKDSQSKHIAEFYKNGSHLERNYEGSITIQSVSKSDEGLYKCKIPGAGESPESWLSVINQNTTAHEDAAHEDTRPSQSHSSNPLPLLWIIVGVSSAAVLLLVMGLVLCRKKVLLLFSPEKPTSGSSSTEDHIVSGEDSVVDPDHVTYALVQKSKKEKAVSAGDCVIDPDHVTYAPVKKQKKEKAGGNAVDPDNVTYAAVEYQKKKKRDKARTKASSPEESVIYSAVYHRPVAPD